jgi:16S rRNA (cytosine1402-N4)-methyltransferase
MLKLDHNPVMLNEVLEIALGDRPEIFVDATFGAGGYTKALLQGGCKKVIAIDQDSSTEKYFAKLAEDYPERIQYINDNFKNIAHVVSEEVDGFVFDLGVSSMQLDQAERGFSFSRSGNLDMRMDRSSSLTAAYIVNNYPEKGLADLIFNFGGERKSKRIARTIVEKRAAKPFETTLDLANAIITAVGSYRDEIHPATRTFQAIRIEVNKELSVLQIGLLAACNAVKVGGRIIVVTFHSLEDAIVKRCFSELCGKQQNANRHQPVLTNHYAEARFSILTKKALQASNEEIKLNPRSRSAKLRAIRRIA